MKVINLTRQEVAGLSDFRMWVTSSAGNMYITACIQQLISEKDVVFCFDAIMTTIRENLKERLTDLGDLTCSS